MQALCLRESADASLCVYLTPAYAFVPQPARAGKTGIFLFLVLAWHMGLFHHGRTCTIDLLVLLRLEKCKSCQKSYIIYDRGIKIKPFHVSLLFGEAVMT